MKFIKKASAVLLALTMLVALCACGKNSAGKGSDSTTANYQVKVLNPVGQLYTAESGVIVRFMQDGTQVAMQMVNDDGIAVKELKKGN